MSSKTTNALILSFTVIGAIVGIVFYPILPKRIAFHWNMIGEASAFESKFWGVFAIPVIMFSLFFLRLITLRIDPLKKNIEQFKGYYNGFWISISMFFLYIYYLVIVWNLGYHFDFTGMVIPAVSVLLYGIGVVLGRSKRNWFIGMKNPKIMMSETIWQKTHRLAGLLYKITAILSLFSIFLPGDFVMAATAIIIISVSIITAAYFYGEYRRR